MSKVNPGVKTFLPRNSLELLSIFHIYPSLICAMILKAKPLTLLQQFACMTALNGHKQCYYMLMICSIYKVFVQKTISSFQCLLPSAIAGKTHLLSTVPLSFASSNYKNYNVHRTTTMHLLPQFA
jgi:hypothetical protein